jgi:hypothetical protein
MREPKLSGNATAPLKSKNYICAMRDRSFRTAAEARGVATPLGEHDTARENPEKT